MGIWIRSQNKLKLTECKEIIIDQNDCFEYIFEGYAIDDIPTILGTYSTEEKAIKVLDMIQEHIATHSNKVFQMPQDEEVVEDA